MSIARGFPNAGHHYKNIVKPIEIACNFVIDHSNGNGLGIRSLKSNGFVRNVFMNTSSTPGSNDGALNPNPVAGFALIQLQQNFNKYLGGFSGFVSQLDGSSQTSVTTGHASVIVSLGTATLAQWLSAGVPAGVTPAVGVSFIAIKTGAIGGSAAVQGPSVSGIQSVEVVGDPNLSINNSSIAQNGGAYLLIQFLGATNSSTTTLIPKAPADNSVCGLTMCFDGSSVTVDGL